MGSPFGKVPALHQESRFFFLGKQSGEGSEDAGQDQRANCHAASAHTQLDVKCRHLASVHMQEAASANQFKNRVDEMPPIIMP